ncbi:MAG: threonine ammonia-lyase [Phycisphaeraceae bacterium]|nr:threonine ammonia-lyase [Phycisphaeraceae bacterium]
MSQPVTLEQIRQAEQAVRGRIVYTPCPRSYLLSELLGCNVHCKLDYLQHTGSFKERGVANALAHVEPGGRGVIAASAGNHALALAYHGRQRGIPVTVVMPIFAPLIKVATCKRLGACVVQEGSSFAEAAAHARMLGKRDQLTYIHGFNNPHVIAGQGTLGLEILEQVPDVDAVIVPVGGGGLIAGVATAIKSLSPRVRIIGVEPERNPLFSQSLTQGEPVTLPIVPTLADGLAVGRMGDVSFAAAAKVVDRVVSVDESQLALAVLRLLELEKAVVEGAGASSLAAMLSGKLPELAGKTVVLPLCGGNIDPLVLRRVIEFGMSVDQRLCRLNVTISDRPGGLAALTQALAEGGASIQEIRHERIFAGPDVNRVLVQLVLETRSGDHLQQIMLLLRDKGYQARLRWQYEQETS